MKATHQIGHMKRGFDPGFISGSRIKMVWKQPQSTVLASAIDSLVRTVLWRGRAIRHCLACALLIGFPEESSVEPLTDNAGMVVQLKISQGSHGLCRDLQ